ncbi:MAG: di/tri-peptidase [Phototrophicaceae bacterium]
MTEDWTLHMTVTKYFLGIDENEYQQRCEVLLNTIQANGLNGVILFNADYVLYYTGFAFIPTERPVAFVMSKEGEKAMFVPRMEVEHAKANALIDTVSHYTEYPDKPHPMTGLSKLLSEMAISGHIGADNDGYPRLFGYRGAKLSALGDFEIFDIVDAIEDQMAIKSQAEIDLLIESTKWSTLALNLLKKYTVVGITETEAVQRANFEATQAMMNAIGSIYKAQGWQKDGAYAEYRGQIGRNSAIPHALANNITFQRGDVLVAESTARVWGYQTELERTFIMGEASPEQARFFQHMLNLQNIAFEMIKPNVLCSDVDKAVRAYYEKEDLLPYWRHHTGHAIGSRYHEGPFLDIGDDTVIQEGMVFTIEPGLYHMDLGGFRHSDTIVVNRDGIEIITYSPSDLDAMTIPV